MSRIDVPEQVTAHVYISADDFKSDLERGYCLIEIFPASTETITDRRSRKSIDVEHKQSIAYRCMRCQFDVVDSTLAAKDGVQRTARQVIEEHVRNNSHPWTYKNFTNPYGHDADVTISGIENYPAEIGGLT